MNLREEHQLLIKVDAFGLDNSVRPKLLAEIGSAHAFNVSKLSVCTKVVNVNWTSLCVLN